MGIDPEQIDFFISRILGGIHGDFLSTTQLKKWDFVSKHAFDEDNRKRNQRCQADPRFSGFICQKSHPESHGFQILKINRPPLKSLHCFFSLF